MSETAHTYVPNTYQKPNVHADRLMKLLSGNEYKLLDVATRDIMGWDENRATKRARISLSRFEERTGLSRPTVVSGIRVLAEANILIPIGEWNSDGQMFELNLGQKGEYDFYYLEHYARRNGNPDPSAAREAKASKQNANTPAISGGEGGLTLLPPENGNGEETLSAFTASGKTVKPEAVKPFYTLNTKQKSMTIKSTEDVVSLGGRQESDADPEAPQNDDDLTAPRLVWQAALDQLQLEMPRSTFDTWLAGSEVVSCEAGSFVIDVANQYRADWLTNRMLGTVTRTLAGVADMDVSVTFVAERERLQANNGTHA